MVTFGVSRLYAKRLAPNDNSKNQVYFGSDFESLNLFPNRGIKPDHAGSKPIFKAALDFYWLDETGVIHQAPGAQLILYPQYPEVRMSGFLKGCDAAPSDLMASRDAGRVLFIGVTNDGRMIGFVAAANSKLVNELDSLGKLPQAGVFSQLALVVDVVDPRVLLLAELRRIHLLEWIDSKRLTGTGTIVDCNAPQCGGYTLEAELGITPNGYADPDFHGWEVKQHTVSNFSNLDVGVITLMTPEPTAGYYKDHGVEAFVRRFGYPDKLGRPDRMNFGGIHKVGMRHPETKLTLTLLGFDVTKSQITDPTGGIVLLSDRGTSAATWLYSDLMEHWNRKHAQAAYVPSQSRNVPKCQYRYGHVVRLGEGTDFLRFLKAMALGSVYYDPGIKLEGLTQKKPKSKRRSQFRISSRNLASLYERMTKESLV